MGNDREHTASTRHLVDVSVTIGGDDGADPAWLSSVIAEALAAAGAEVLAVTASPDIGLDGEDMAMCILDEERNDVLYAPVNSCELRQFDVNEEVLWSPSELKF